jgi:hypothetical protein
MTGIGFRLRRSPEKVDSIAEKSLAAQTREASFCQQHLPAVRRGPPPERGSRIPHSIRLARFEVNGNGCLK